MADKSTLLSQNHIADETSLKYMLKLAAPMVVTNISFTVMQFVDRFMVSRLGTEALAAILPAGIISFVPVSFTIGVMTSVNTFVSQSLGRGQKYGAGVSFGCGGHYVAGRTVDIQDTGARAGGCQFRSHISSDYALCSVSGDIHLGEQPILYGSSSADYYDVCSAVFTSG